MINKAISRRAGSSCLSSVLLLSLAAAAQADDIDVYTAQVSAQQKPNILFVLDYSGSMAADIYGSYEDNGNPKKIDILKSAMHTVLDNNVDYINAGIGSLYSKTTTGIRWPISELSADASTVDPDITPGKYTVADIMGMQVDERDSGGGTATVDALVEAAQYFRGDAVTHNDSDPNDGSRHEPATWDSVNDLYTGGDWRAATPSSYSPANAYDTNHTQTYYCNDFSTSGGPNYCEGKSTSSCAVMGTLDSPTPGYERQENLWGSYSRCEYMRTQDWMGAHYNSPITQTCQANTIVLISDGQPTWLNDGESLRSIVGTGVDGCDDLSLSIFEMPDGMQIEGNCGPEVVRTLANNDQNPDIPGSVVNTYTVGFNVEGPGKEYLKLLASEGQGSFFSANEPEELNAALSAIVDEVLGGSENFAELSIDIDKANFSHDNRAFFGLFSPTSRRSWQGNLKGYFVDNTGLIDIHGLPATVATDKGEQFAETAQSFWSDEVDGNSVIDGGASEQLQTATRKLYTFTGTTISSIGAPLAGVAANRLDSGNDQVTASMMGLPDGSAKRELALDWLQSAPMGDPLHSKSVQVNYGTQTVVYLSTNQGLLHAIDATAPTDSGSSDSTGGEELFAYMPPRLLANLPDLMENANTGAHIYGLDGGITRWHTDTNNDGIVNNGEKLLLVLGMRRGGTAYHALDVSDPDSPRLAWVIDELNSDFPQLTQSWSRMSLIKVRDGTGERKVLAFAAGYDADVQDPVNAPAVSKGNAIYMIDDSGDLLWQVDSRDHAAMQYSIASDLTVIDSDRDSLADRIYVGDLGGQLWRIDFDDIRSTPDVTLLADLDDGDHQPIFYAPSVALNRDGGEEYLSVSVGSGNRTNPLLAGLQNNIYMIRDIDVDKGAPASGFTTIEPTDLFDATNDTISSADADVATDAQEDLDAARGWRVALASNEKALSRLVTFEGKLLATTFEAEPQIDPLSCGFDTTGRFYMMDINSAAPVPDLYPDSTRSSDSNPAARSRVLESSGIPSSPVIVFPKGSGTVQVIVDKESVNLINQKLSRVYWHAR